jgi:predicted SnoaL-like aldol condensation-catalyzing enzyme
VITRRSLALPSLLGLLAAASSDAAPSETATSSCGQADANKRLVLDFWRVVIEARDLDAIGRYCGADFIQHNPMMKNGIAGFAERARTWWADGGKRPVQPTLRNPPALVVAENDLILLMFKRPTPVPTDPSRTYDLFTFDLYRVADGKIVEHWDGVRKQAA